MFDLKISWQALTNMPKVSPVQWKQLGVIARWLIATRAAVFIMTLTASWIAGLMAYHHHLFRWDRFLYVCLGLVSAHACNNLLNDRSDHKRGVDKDNAFRTQYGTQPVEEGMMSVQQSLIWAGITALPGIICGIILCVEVPMVIPFFISGLILVFAYNWPLKHYGLGEPTVIAVWGPLMVGGGYLAITGEWSWSVAWISIPYAIGPTIVLFGKHTDKIPWDKARGIRTLPVIIGDQWARKIVLILIIIQYACIPLFIYAQILDMWAALCLLSVGFVKDVVTVYRQEKPNEKPDDFPNDVWPLWYSAYAFVHCRRFGILYVLSLVISVFSAK